MKKFSSTYVAGVVLVLGGCVSSGSVSAQQVALAALPDAPGSVPIANTSSSLTSAGDADIQDTGAQTAQSPGNGPHYDGQTKRILGIIPNFRAVNADAHLPPQSPKEKFITATEDTFDYSAILLPALLAGYSQATNATPEFHQGAAGYGRYFWHTYVDQSVENYSVEFLFPVLTHEDTRYYTLGKGGFFKRAGYSLSRSVVTRNDAGHDTFNISEVGGAAFAAGISNLYYPSAERAAGKTVDKFALNVAIDAGTFMFKEFWPDINHALFHQHNQ